MDAAALQAYLDGKVVSHISVIGCEAVEEGIPEYKGVPTCNIRNVPVEDAHELAFHINHTGTMVPTGFYNSDGTKPVFRVGTAPTIGHPDDIRAPRYTDPVSVVMADVYQRSPFPPIPPALPWLAPELDFD